MKSKIVVVSLYYGRLPSYFQLWLDSAGENCEIHWLFYTDCDMRSYYIPQNVTIVTSSFSQMYGLLKHKLGYEPDYHVPWDICKFKVVFGKVFEEELEGADYWAWTDCDLIYGDLSLATKHCEAGVDKILPKGHLSFLRNDPRIVKAILNDTKISRILCADKMERGSGCIDEDELRFEILPRIGAKQVNDIPYANFYPRYGHFQLQDALPLCQRLGYVENPIPGLRLPCVFVWESGRLRGSFAMPDGSVRREDCAYIHFFKRDIVPHPQRFKRGRSYLIAPNFIREYDGHDLTWQEIARMDRWRIHWRYLLKRMNMKVLVRKLGLA